MACSFEEMIDRRVLGDLGPGELDALRAHIAGCPSCAGRFEEAGYVESLLVGAFRDVESRLGSPREAVLRAIHGGPEGVRDSRRAPAVRAPRRRVGLFVLVNALAAALILAASSGYLYLSLVRLKRQALATEARVEVKNLAIVLRVRAAARDATAPAPADLAPALAKLGLARDAFGNRFVLEDAPPAPRLYSCGANGRDDRGAGDDIVAWFK